MQIGKSNLEKRLEVIWYQKFELAVEQLADSIKLFFEKRYISSITLAGASEEILGGILNKQGKKSSLEKETEVFTNALESIEFENLQEAKDWFKFSKNETKNHLKHLTLTKDKRKKILNLIPELDKEFGVAKDIAIYPLEAITLIKRGIENYSEIGKSDNCLDKLIKEFNAHVERLSS